MATEPEKVPTPSIGSLDDFQDAAEMVAKHAERGVVFSLFVGLAGCPTSSVWTNGYTPEHCEAMTHAIRIRINSNRIELGLEPL